MQEYFDKVKPAVNLGATLPSEGAVAVHNGRLEAKTAFMAISVPCPFKDFSVPGVDLDFALRKVGECTVNVTAQNLTLKSGRGSTRIKLTEVPPPLVKPEADTWPVEGMDDLMAVLDDVFPFTIGDASKPWSFGARFDECAVTATNGFILCRGELISSSGFTGRTMSRAGLAYLRERHEELEAWGWARDGGFLLEFTDGSWVHVAPMTAEMPDVAVNLLDKVMPEGSFDALREVTPEYLEKFMQSVDHTEDRLQIFPDHIFGVRRASDHKCPVDTTLGEGVKFAIFDAKMLVTVLSRAHRIGFEAYPKPVPFVTKHGSRGLLAGQT